MVYFSTLLGRPVFDTNCERIGSLRDLVFVDGENLGEVSHIIYITQTGLRKKVSWKYVAELKDPTANAVYDIYIYLNVPAAGVVAEGEQDSELLLGELLDKQVIDVNGLKVVRVNDIILAKVAGKFCVVGVDVGTKTMLRRIFGRAAEAIFKRFKDHIIPWEFVEKLDPKLHEIKVKVQGSKVGELHPADIADIMEDLTYKDRILIFKSLDEDVAARALVESGTDVKKDIFKGLKGHRIAAMLNRVKAVDSAEILSLLPKEESDNVLAMMHPDKAKRIKLLLGYGEESAGRMMHFNFISIPSTFTAEDTINKLRELSPSSDYAYYLYVVDEQQKLVGILSLRDLVVAQPARLVSELMHGEVLHVHPETPREEATKMLIKYGLMALPVIDSEGIVKGIVTAEEFLDAVAPKVFKHTDPVSHGHRKKKNGSVPEQSAPKL